MKARFVKELKELDAKGVIELTMSPIEAWIIFSQLQLALRHPGNNGEGREIAVDFARKLQAIVAVTPALRTVAEMGWDEASKEGWREDRKSH